MTLFAAAAIIADLCGAPLAREPVDREDARAYVEVGDDARAAGDVRVAATAYRKAAALDPDNVHAREALSALCRGDAAQPDEATLLAAIAQYRSGALDDARAAFDRIVRERAASAAGAHFFLGLIALQEHRGGEAVRELEAARVAPEYAELAAPLVRLAHRDGTIAAVALAAPEIDTNPQLLPDTPPAGSTTGPRVTDEDLLFVGTVTARPSRWLVLRDIASWRKQRTLSSLDFFGETLQVGVELDRHANHLAIRYDLDEDVVGGDAYLFANRGAVAVRRELGRTSLVASYGLRRRDFQRLAQAPFTGWVHAADVGVVVHPTARIDVDARLVGWREITADRSFSDVAGGAQIGLRTRIGARTRLASSLVAWSARYDVAEPDGVSRTDLHGEAGLDVEVDLGNHVMTLCGASVLGNRSTVEDFRYWKLVARCGFAVAVGGP